MMASIHFLGWRIIQEAVGDGITFEPLKESRELDFSDSLQRLEDFQAPGLLAPGFLILVLGCKIHQVMFQGHQVLDHTLRRCIVSAPLLEAELLRVTVSHEEG